MCGMCVKVSAYKLAFHDADTDTDTDTDSPNTATILRPKHHTLFPREDPREEIACVGRVWCRCPCPCRRRGMPAVVNFAAATVVATN